MPAVKAPVLPVEYPGPKRDKEIADGLQAVVIPTRLPVEPLNAIVTQPLVIALDGPLLQPRPPFGIPEQCNQVGDIMQPGLDIPLLPINQIDALLGRLAG